MAEGHMARAPQEWGIPTELVEIAEARNSLAVLSKKPITEEASLKFRAVGHVKGALASYPT